MPEYCGVISKSPTVKAVKAKIEAEEEHFDFSILDKVVEEASNIDIREIAQQTEETVVEVETVITTCYGRYTFTLLKPCSRK